MGHQQGKPAALVSGHSHACTALAVQVRMFIHLQHAAAHHTSCNWGIPGKKNSAERFCNKLAFLCLTLTTKTPWTWDGHLIWNGHDLGVHYVNRAPGARPASCNRRSPDCWRRTHGHCKAVWQAAVTLAGQVLKTPCSHEIIIDNYYTFLTDLLSSGACGRSKPDPAVPAGALQGWQNSEKPKL